LIRPLDLLFEAQVSEAFDELIPSLGLAKTLKEWVHVTIPPWTRPDRARSRRT
jgi:hypothetical protein